MKSSIPHTRRSSWLKELLRREGKAIALCGPANVVVARMMESLGYEAIYVGGGNVVGRMMGRSDEGSITLTESAMFAKWFAEGVSIPVWIDAGSCFGGPPQVERAVKEYIHVGAAAVTIEDLPVYASGGAAGKHVVPIEEALDKYRAAVATRDDLDPDFQIVAQCDALEALNGGGVSGAIERLNAYKEVGVDVLYLGAPGSFEELADIRAAVDGPLMCTTHRLPRDITAQEAADIGLCVAHSRRPRQLLGRVELAAYSLFLTAGAPAVAEMEERVTALLRTMVDVDLGMAPP